MSTIHKGMSIENEQETKATDLKPEIYPLKMTDYHKNRFSARQCKKWTVSRQIFFTVNVSSGLPRSAAKSAVKSGCGSAVLTLVNRFHPGYKLVGHIRRSVQVFWKIRPPPSTEEEEEESRYQPMFFGGRYEKRARNWKKNKERGKIKGGNFKV
jgi:hypothetical protein